MLNKVKKILPFLYNKYVVVALFFVVWVLFFDRDSIVRHLAMQRNIRQMQKEILHYRNTAKQNSARLNELKTNPDALEQFARERYGMLRADEDVFIIVE